MKFTYWCRAMVLVLLGSLAIASTAAAQGPPPPPTAVNGNPVTPFTTVAGTPVAFASDGTHVFIAAGPGETPDGSPGPAGGLFVSNGSGPAVQVPGVAPVVFGVTYHKDTLYVSTGGKIVAYSGWNGTTFDSSRVVADPGKGFGSFSGLAVGPDNRLYAGVALNEKFDNKKDPSPLARRVVSMQLDGSQLRTVARGLRQPWQLAFASNSARPWVSELGQEEEPIGNDFIAHVRRGQNYGFPKCTQARKKPCRRFTKPAIVLPPHTSPMGMAAVGPTLYVAMFTGTGDGPMVASLPARRGATPTPVLRFALPVVSVGVFGGQLYAGDVTGTVYRVAL
jgi:glucose/arabinose dehydrogenase